MKKGKGKEGKASKIVTSGCFQGHVVPGAKIKAPDRQGPGGSRGVSMGVRVPCREAPPGFRCWRTAPDGSGHYSLA